MPDDNIVVVYARDYRRCPYSDHSGRSCVYYIPHVGIPHRFGWMPRAIETVELPDVIVLPLEQDELDESEEDSSGTTVD